MNDFTKEELNIIYEFLDYSWEDYSAENDIFKFKDKISIIRGKIHSLIDNYCEHEMLDSASNPMCIKCGIYP
jgi:hypothetical protein